MLFVVLGKYEEEYDKWITAACGCGKTVWRCGKMSREGKYKSLWAWRDGGREEILKTWIWEL